jgi:hypothetical protein
MRTRLGCLLLSVLLLSACGDPTRTPDRSAPETPEPPDSPLVRLVNAAGEKLVTEGSARVEMRMSAVMPEAAGGGLLAGRGRGALNLASQSGWMNFKVTTSGPVPLNMSMKMVTEYPFIYMNFGDFFEQLPQGPPGMKPWLRMNLETMGDQMGIDMDALTQFGQNDMSSYAFYTQGVEKVEEVGREKVRGVPATRYTTTVDFERLQEAAPEHLKATFENLTRLMGISELSMDVWLNDRGQLVREQIEMPIPAGGDTITSTMDMTYFDFGTDVRVDVPPEDKVMDFEELLQMAPDETTVAPSEEGV